MSDPGQSARTPLRFAVVTPWARTTLVALALSASLGGCAGSRPQIDRPLDAAMLPLEELRSHAETGFPVAQLELGRRYAAGRDVPPDRVSAWAWLRMAEVGAAPGAALARAELEATLSPVELLDARGLVRQWARTLFHQSVQKNQKRSVPYRAEAPRPGLPPGG